MNILTGYIIYYQDGHEYYVRTKMIMLYHDKQRYRMYTISISVNGVVIFCYKIYQTICIYYILMKTALIFSEIVIFVRRMVKTNLYYKQF